MPDPTNANLATDPVPDAASPATSATPATPEAAHANAETAETSGEPKPSYVKLAMRNMVRKGGQSLFHFGLTTVGLLGLFVGLAYLTR
ncbi:MAG: DUF3285 domain-containing protein [Geitlerinemataceae cyanobacterium]